MGERVKVRRERPGALAWALALMLTALCVYLITLGEGRAPEAAVFPEGDQPRVTEEVVFAPLRAWCVCLGTYETAQEARIEAARYTPRGAAGYVLEEDGAYLVLGALYDAEDDARRVAENLSQTEGLSCTVYAAQAERVRLRVTAAQEQIAAVTGAEAALRAYAQEARRIALQIDRAEIDSETARTLLNVAAGRLEAALNALRAIPGSEENAVCARLQALVEQFRASLFVLSGENSKTTLSLSGKIKYNTIGITLEHMRYLRELNGL